MHCYVPSGTAEMANGTRHCEVVHFPKRVWIIQPRDGGRDVFVHISAGARGSDTVAVPRVSTHISCKEWPSTVASVSAASEGLLHPLNSVPKSVPIWLLGASRQGGAIAASLVGYQVPPPCSGDSVDKFEPGK